MEEALRESLPVLVKPNSTLSETPVARFVAPGEFGTATSLLDVVHACGPYLTDGSDAIKGVAALKVVNGSVSHHVRCGTFDSTQQKTLVVFFFQKFKDFLLAEQAVAGMHTCVVRCGFPLPEDIAADIASKLFTTTQVHVLSQTTRRRLYDIALHLLAFGSAVTVPSLVRGFMAAIDKERDPENVLVAFRLHRRIVNACPASVLAPMIDDMCEVVSCYFPLVFSPASNCDVTRDELRNELHLALSASQLMKASVPFLLEKLGSAIVTTKMDCFDVIRRMLQECVDSDPTVSNHATSDELKDLYQGVVGETLRIAADLSDGTLQGKEGLKLLDAGLGAVVSLGRALGRLLTGDSAQQLAVFLHSFVTDIVSGIDGKLPALGGTGRRKKQPIPPRPYATVAHALCSGSHAVCSTVCNVLLPLLVSLYKEETLSAARDSSSFNTDKLGAVFMIASALLSACEQLASSEIDNALLSQGHSVAMLTVQTKHVDEMYSVVANVADGYVASATALRRVSQSQVPPRTHIDPVANDGPEDGVSTHNELASLSDDISCATMECVSCFIPLASQPGFGAVCSSTCVNRLRRLALYGTPTASNIGVRCIVNVSRVEPTAILQGVLQNPANHSPSESNNEAQLTEAKLFDLLKGLAARFGKDFKKEKPVSAKTSCLMSNAQLALIREVLAQLLDFQRWSAADLLFDAMRIIEDLCKTIASIASVSDGPQEEANEMLIITINNVFKMVLSPKGVPIGLFESYCSLLLAVFGTMDGELQRITQGFLRVDLVPEALDDHPLLRYSSSCRKQATAPLLQNGVLSAPVVPYALLLSFMSVVSTEAQKDEDPETLLQRYAFAFAVTRCNTLFRMFRTGQAGWDFVQWAVKAVGNVTNVTSFDRWPSCEVHHRTFMELVTKYCLNSKLSGSPVAVTLCVVICKALCSKGDIDVGMQLSARLTDILSLPTANNENLFFGDAFATIVSADQECAHSVPGWRKDFCTRNLFLLDACQRLQNESSGEEAGTSSHPIYTAVAAVLQHVDDILDRVTVIVPIVRRMLKAPTTIEPAALSNCLLVVASVLASSQENFNATVSNYPDVIEDMVVLGTSADVPMECRKDALTALEVLADCREALPALVKYKPVVVKSVVKALADRKRVVRQAAQKCSHKWHLIA